MSSIRLGQNRRKFQFRRPDRGAGARHRDRQGTLRAWERRDGFPRLVWNAVGDRLYPAEQVARLLLIDLGYRPGRLVGADDGELAALAARHGKSQPAGEAGPASPGEDGEPASGIARRHQSEGVRPIAG